jgi:hypothetical protein
MNLFCLFPLKWDRFLLVYLSLSGLKGLLFLTRVLFILSLCIHGVGPGKNFFNWQAHRIGVGSSQRLELIF